MPSIASLASLAAAAAFFLLGLLAVGVGFAISRDLPAPVPTGDNVIEGRVVSGAQVSGTNIVVAWLSMGARVQAKGTQTWTMAPMFEGTIGISKTQIKTADGLVVIDVNSPNTQFRVFEIEETVVSTLQGHQFEHFTPNWRQTLGQHQFIVKVLALRSGDDVTAVMDINGQLAELWLGTRADLKARNAAVIQKGMKISKGLYIGGLVGILLGVLVFLRGFLISLF